jgi:hypothetical protein
LRTENHPSDMEEGIVHMRSSHHLELHQVGTRDMLAVAARGVSVGTDELHTGVGGSVYDTYGRSVLLSRAQVEELHDWLGRWLAEGWDDVPPVQGPTSADIIEHYREVAVRERVRADRERRDGGRLLAAALSLIPAEVQAGRPELEAVAAGEAAAWQHLQADADRGEQARLIFLAGLHQIEDAIRQRDSRRALEQNVEDAEAFIAKIRKALGKVAERGADPVVTSG